MTSRAGLITVAEMYVERISKFFPPEHHVRAVRLPKNQELATWRMFDVLVEGPKMPEWPDCLVDPSRVSMDIEVVTDPGKPRMGLFASWMLGRTRLHNWLVKEWNLVDFENSESHVAAAMIEEFYHGGEVGQTRLPGFD